MLVFSSSEIHVNMCWSFIDTSSSSSPPCPTHFPSRVSLPAALHVSHDQAILSVSVSLWALGAEGSIGVAGATTVLGTQEEEGTLCCVDARPGRVGETPETAGRGCGCRMPGPLMKKGLEPRC